MSVLRARLRMQCLKKEDNLLANDPDEVIGHELDWLALQIGWQYSLESGNVSAEPHAGATLLNYRSWLAKLTDSSAGETRLTPSTRK